MFQDPACSSYYIPTGSLSNKKHAYHHSQCNSVVFPLLLSLQQLLQAHMHQLGDLHDHRWPKAIQLIQDWWKIRFKRKGAVLQPCVQLIGRRKSHVWKRKLKQIETLHPFYFRMSLLYKSKLIQKSRNYKLMFQTTKSNICLSVLILHLCGERAGEK